MMPKTVCIDSYSGREIAIYPYLMKLVEVGAEFYIGQQPYIVESFVLSEEHGEAVVELNKKRGDK